MMMPILHGLPSVSVMAAEFLVASIWQGLVVVGCVAVLLRVLRGLTAAVRSVIWTAVLLLVVLGPAVSVGLRGGGGSAVGHVGNVACERDVEFGAGCCLGSGFAAAVGAAGG